MQTWDVCEKTLLTGRVKPFPGRIFIHGEMKPKRLQLIAQIDRVPLAEHRNRDREQLWLQQLMNKIW